MYSLICVSFVKHSETQKMSLSSTNVDVLIVVIVAVADGWDDRSAPPS